MNRNIIFMVVLTAITIISVSALGYVIVENQELKNELNMVKSYDEFKYEEWKKNQNKDDEKVLGCGVTTELRSDGKCYPNPEI